MENKDLILPRQQLHNQKSNIPGPTYDAFTTRFGHAFPEPLFLTSDLGSTAVYNFEAPSGTAKRHVLIIHGIDTPALGMLPLAQRIQELEVDTHIVLFDSWGKGFSSTPLVPHRPHVYHFQVLQVLSHVRWTSADIIGYSFGGSLAVSFTLDHPWISSSVTLLGPAGLLKFDAFDKEMQELLRDSTGREQQAIDYLINFLEDGGLVVPSDWKERTEKGEVVAEATREFSMREHAGYGLSILSAFREGGVYGREAMFAEFAKLPVRKSAVVGELDPVASKEELNDLGFETVKVIPQKGHDFPRSAAVKTAEFIHQFWQESA
jgi:pimeloyl-ACP methyl ester carboxylesterase